VPFRGFDVISAKMLSALQNISPLQFVAASLGFYALYRLYFELTVGQARRKMIREHGCKRPPVYPHVDPFGVDIALKISKYEKARIVLEQAQKRFQTYGNTYMLKIMGLNSVYFFPPRPGAYATVRWRYR
jgi:hypothetical protein